MNTVQPVQISYNELIDRAQLSTILPRLCTAFGNDPDCLGILLVTDLPPEYKDLRQRVLLSASYIANLPTSDLEKLENEKSSYLVGWSRGREQFRGQPDVNKGSFYVNPMYDYPADQETDFPEYETANLWPAESPEFKDNLEALGQLIVHVGQYVARACDAYVRIQMSDYQQDYLEQMVKTSRTCKARLLHYFPISKTATPRHETEDEDADAWCGEHLDHGCLTGLTSAMYLNDSPSSAHTREKEIRPDSRAGLYIKSRSNKTYHLRIPKSALAFQTGQALEVTTSAKLRAVPHFVRGSSVPGIARNTLAVFMQPNLEDELGPSGLKFKDFVRGIVQENYTSSVS